MGQLRFDELQVLGFEFELNQKPQHFICASKDCVASFEGRLSEVSFEERMLIVTSGFPLTIGHGDLVKVCEKRINPVEGLL